MELNENVSGRFLIQSEVVVTTQELIDEQDAGHKFFDEVWSGWEGDRSDLQIEKLRVTSVVELPADSDEYVREVAVGAIEQIASAWKQLQELEKSEVNVGSSE